MQPTLKLSAIVSGPNHRQYFDPQAMKELEAGIRAAGGVTQPILVRPHPEREGVFEIMAGERCWRAARTVHGDDYDMPVVIRDASDAEARSLGIIENHFRDDTSDVEQAEGAASLLAYNKGDKHETALQLGWNVDTLERRLLLLNCAPARSAPTSGASSSATPNFWRACLPAGRTRCSVASSSTRCRWKCSRSNSASSPSGLPMPSSTRRSASAAPQLGAAGFAVRRVHRRRLLPASEPLRRTDHGGTGGARRAAARSVPGRAFRPAGGRLPATTVGPDGPMGVGATQYTACKGCENFGCSLSAMAGSYGEVHESLCFDAACHAKKVSAHRKAVREAARSSAEGSGPADAGPKPLAEKGSDPASGATAAHHVPARVVTYRIEQWRKWAANALMAQPQRNQRVLAALVLAGDMRAVVRDRYAEVAAKVTGAATSTKAASGPPLRKAIEQADSFDDQQAATMVRAVAGSGLRNRQRRAGNDPELPRGRRGQVLRARWRLPGPADRQRTGVAGRRGRTETGHGRRLWRRPGPASGPTSSRHCWQFPPSPTQARCRSRCATEAGLRQDGSDRQRDRRHQPLRPRRSLATQPRLSADG
jgi:ParB/RepB/Spo0J family partition protein